MRAASNELNVSVGVTYALRRVTETQGTVLHDYTTYESTLDAPPSNADGFSLPWPAYPSRFWHYLLTDEYENASPSMLRSALVPLRWEYVDDAPPAGFVQLRSEAFLHPFALTTVLHVAIGRNTMWVPDAECATAVENTLKFALGPRKLRDGLPADVCPPLPAADADDLPYRLSRVGTFFVLTALGDAVQEGGLAYHLATRFTQLNGGHKAVPLGAPGSGASIDGETVGLTIARQTHNARKKAGCYHRNIVTLIAMLQNMSTLLGPSVAEVSRRYQRQAALVLNHYFRGVPLSIEGPRMYRSKIAPLWIKKRGWTDDIDRVNTEAENGVPKVTTGAPPSSGPSGGTGASGPSSSSA